MALPDRSLRYVKTRGQGRAQRLCGSEAVAGIPVFLASRGDCARNPQARRAEIRSYRQLLFNEVRWSETADFAFGYAAAAVEDGKAVAYFAGESSFCSTSSTVKAVFLDQACEYLANLERRCW